MNNGRPMMMILIELERTESAIGAMCVLDIHCMNHEVFTYDRFENTEYRIEVRSNRKSKDEAVTSSG
jgi:hypothetical protein